MNQLWIETVGQVSLYVFFILVGACLVSLVIRVVLRRFGLALDRGSVLGDLIRFVVEYLGNTSLQELTEEFSGGDRRRNRQARILMDQVRREMAKHQASSDETEKLMEELRETVRSEGQGPTS